MGKFNVGDKVRILDGRNIECYCGGWNSSLASYIGDIVTIKIVESDGKFPGCRMKEIDYIWDERGLELVSSSSNKKRDINSESPFKIKNWTYNERKGITIIEWEDGTKTQVKVQYGEKADPYSGFINACAKKAFGNDNTVKKLYEEWAIKKPIRDKKEKENRKEQERIKANKQAKKNKWLIRKRAIELAREYEARKLANKKYGVPIDAFSDNDKNDK